MLPQYRRIRRNRMSQGMCSPGSRLFQQFYCASTIVSCDRRRIEYAQIVGDPVLFSSRPGFAARDPDYVIEQFHALFFYCRFACGNGSGVYIDELIPFIFKAG